MSDCDKCIHTLHAPLIHKARDIQYQSDYKNGSLDAEIIDVAHHNLQFALESYFSQVGIPIIDDNVIGEQNRVNTIYETNYEFIPDTLDVFLSGDKMVRDVDFQEVLVDIGGGDWRWKGFEFLLNTNDPGRLNIAPKENESLRVNYLKRITFNTKGGT